MILDNLKINAYKGISTFEITPGKLNVLAGKNGAGKSSVLEAIRYAVTGVSELDDISKTDVSVKLLGGKEIHRVSGKVKVEGSATSQDSVRKLLEDGTGVSLDSMKVVTSAKLLASMKADKLGEFLITSGLINMDLDYDTVLRLCNVEAPAARILAKYLPKMPERFGLEAVENAYKEVYDSRTGLNRDIKTTELRAKFDGEKPVKSGADIDRALGEIAKGEEKLNTYNTLLKNWNETVAGNEKINRQIADIEMKIKSTSVAVPNDDERRQLADQDAAIQREINELHSTVQTMSKTIEVNQKMLDNLEISVCPLNDTLVCKTDKAAIKGDLIASITNIKTLKDKNTAKIDELLNRSTKYQE
ncbi:MAG: AAA family ATPase, partial [Clostridiales bacterium]|nr:AAA family ATPase [Clostridiales bacterium]